MKKIFKYSLSDDYSVVWMPTGAVVLTVQVQNGRMCLWAMVDEYAEPERRDFEIVGTGHEFDTEGMKYISTVQTPPYVWHVFERLMK